MELRVNKMIRRETGKENESRRAGRTVKDICRLIFDDTDSILTVTKNFAVR